MATGTTFGGIDVFYTLVFATHEMWGMGDEVVVAIVGAKVCNAERGNGAARGANVGRGGDSGGFGCCRTFHPSSAAEGGRVDGGAGEDVAHGGSFGDVPTGEITGEGGGTSKRARQS